MLRKVKSLRDEIDFVGEIQLRWVKYLLRICCGNFYDLKVKK